MNHMVGLFIVSFITSLVSQLFQSETVQKFETVDSLYSQYIDSVQIANSFEGHQWLENHLSPVDVNLDHLYQDNLKNKTLSRNSKVNKIKRSYQTWIEERICLESPYMDKPVRASMTSRFGRRVHPLSGHSHVHAGVDFRGRKGTPVLASAAGIAKVVRRKGNYGKTIIVDHGNSYTTLYAHLSGYAVKEGEWVNQGQTIGYIGRTGRVTGPHLHFEVRCHNVPLNPRKYLGKSGKVAEVRFRRRYRNRSRYASRRANRKVAEVSRDPNYYTRMINLKKLENLKLKAKKF